ncbi:DUF6683 family protein [Croceibacterium sp. TMG7-5b_MA50]|uniref:DUF6683 family protein n=1 Tax=Croceibacterium sp. TMG7-5b_MA50 TaxID=3121290 RepID=UPI0032219BA3
MDRDAAGAVHQDRSFTLHAPRWRSRWLLQCKKSIGSSHARHARTACLGPAIAAGEASSAFANRQRRRAAIPYLRLFAAALLLSPALAPQPVSAQAAASPATITFTRDPTRFEAKKEQIAATFQQASPEAGAQVRQFLAQDLLALIAQPMAAMGLDTQNVIDMVATYWIAAHDAVNGVVGQQTDPALARAARDQIAATMAGDTQLTQMSEAERQDLADTMLLQALLIEGRMQSAAGSGPAMVRQMSDQIYQEASALTGTDLRAVNLTTAGFVPKAGAAARSASSTTAAATASSPAQSAPAAHAANWDKVDGVYFKLFYGTGVGGMMTMDYEPVVLFTDGTYYEVEGPALEDVDLAASRQAEPRNWGRWTRSGNSFTLTDWEGDGDTLDLQDGQFFKAFDGPAGGDRLDMKYERISGGGNTALGGEMMIVSQSELTFAPDGRYTKGSFGGAMGSGAQSGVGMTVGSNRPATGIGRYTIDRHTITLAEPDGSTSRQFFAFGSSGNPAELDRELIFVGERVFVHMD